MSKELLDGEHRVQITCAGGRSEELKFEARDGSIAQFECGPYGALYSIPSQFLGKAPWLDLVQTEPS
jgi:hypothetical protein